MANPLRALPTCGRRRGGNVNNCRLPCNLSLRHCPKNTEPPRPDWKARTPPSDRTRCLQDREHSVTYRAEDVARRHFLNFFWTNWQINSSKELTTSPNGSYCAGGCIHYAVSVPSLRLRIPSTNRCSPGQTDHIAEHQRRVSTSTSSKDDAQHRSGSFPFLFCLPCVYSL